VDVSELTTLRDVLRVDPGTRVDLSQFDPAASRAWSKPAAENATNQQMDRLAYLQDPLWPQANDGVLVVLQGIGA